MLATSRAGPRLPLANRLAVLRHDGYERRRKSIRPWPRKRQQDQIGSPQIRYANLDELHDAIQLQSLNA